MLMCTHLGEPLNVTITSNPPNNNQFCKNEEIMLLCQANDVTKPVYEWSTSKTNLSDQTSSITVNAPPMSLEYFCNVKDLASERVGQASIVIVGDGKTYNN